MADNSRCQECGEWWDWCDCEPPTRAKVTLTFSIRSHKPLNDVSDAYLSNYVADHFGRTTDNEPVRGFHNHAADVVYGDIEIGGVEWVDGSRLPHAPVVKLEDAPCPWTTSFRGTSLPCSGRAGHPGQCFSYVERRRQRDVTP